MAVSEHVTPIAPDLPADGGLEGLGGLLALVEGRPVALPLRVVTVRAHLVENVARTLVTQEFANTLAVPVEAVHIFPLPEDGAVVAMRLKSGDLTVTAECRTREQAEAEFTAARAAGLEAGLLTAETADVHTLRVTNLPPGESVQVELEVVETLVSEDGYHTWRFPTVIAPRYLPGEPISHQGSGVNPDTDRVPHASRLQPPLRLEGGTELDLEVTIEGQVRSLRSSLHAVRFDLDAGAGVRVAPSTQATLDRDFVLSYALDRPESNWLRAWTDGKFTLLGIEPPEDLEAPSLPREAVLVIDTSGSMAGGKLAAAKVALKTVMHGLREGDRFKLIAFSNTPQAMSTEPLAYDQTALEAADAWIDALQAEGGTEMLSAVQTALAGQPEKGLVRTVVLITDGQAWNEDELVAAVFHRRAQALFFTLGIDTAVNGSLLKRLAKAGGGACTLVTPGEDLRMAVAGVESRIGLPLADGLKVSTGEPADPNLPALFLGQTAAVLLKGSPRSLTVSGRNAGGTIKANVRPARTSIELAPLWARARVGALEGRWAAFPSEREGLRGEIQALALEYHIASRFTAFVAVQRQIRADGTPIELVQPVELPHSWSESFIQPQAAFSIGTPSPRSLIAPHLREDLALNLSAPPARAGAGFKRLSTRRRRDMAVDQEREALEALLVDQRADGSWGGDPLRTAAALACLVLSGHTRLSGHHRQAVRKAHSYLVGQDAAEAVQTALKLLAAAEVNGAIDRLDASRIQALRALGKAVPEGKLLKTLLKRRSARAAT